MKIFRNKMKIKKYVDRKTNVRKSKIEIGHTVLVKKYGSPKLIRTDPVPYKVTTKKCGGDSRTPWSHYH